MKLIVAIVLVLAAHAGQHQERVKSKLWLQKNAIMEINYDGIIEQNESANCCRIQKIHSSQACRTAHEIN